MCMVLQSTKPAWCPWWPWLYLSCTLIVPWLYLGVAIFILNLDMTLVYYGIPITILEVDMTLTYFGMVIATWPTLVWLSSSLRCLAMKHAPSKAFTAFSGNFFIWRTLHACCQVWKKIKDLRQVILGETLLGSGWKLLYFVYTYCSFITLVINGNDSIYIT